MIQLGIDVLRRRISVRGSSQDFTEAHALGERVRGVYEFITVTSQAGLPSTGRGGIAYLLADVA